MDHGSLCLSLQQVEEKKEIKAEWGISKNNRRTRFYTFDRERPRATCAEGQSVAQYRAGDVLDCWAKGIGGLKMPWWRWTRKRRVEDWANEIKAHVAEKVQ